MIEVLGFIIGAVFFMNYQDNLANEKRIKELEKRPAAVVQPIEVAK